MPVGTLVLPSESDVRSGILYGADGTEFIGTLSVPVSGGGALVSRLSSAVAVLRDQGLIEAVIVEPRGAGDLYPLSEGWEAHRLPQTSADAAGLGTNQVTWALYKIAGQTGIPNRLCRITDPDGVVWIADHVEAGYGRLHYRCFCTRALT